MSNAMTNTNQKHPKALYTLFFAELWERFSFYGIRVLLMFYMTSELGFQDVAAYGIYGMYFALVTASTVVGGYLADQYLGNQKAIFLGGIIIVMGHVCLLIFNTKDLFMIGLGFIVAGTGFFKANITSLLGQYYEPNDPRRDSGFTIFYMGINIGAFLAPFICGFVGRKYGWHYGFGISGIGMILGLFVLYMNQDVLGDKGRSPNIMKLYGKSTFGLSLYQWIIIGSLLSIPFFAWCINQHEFMENFLPYFGAVVFSLLLFMAFKCQGDERKSMLTIILMLPFFVAFWASFEQAGASVNFFIERHVYRNFMGYEIPTGWFLSLTPFFIVVLGPVFSILWIQLGKRKLEPLTPIKFALAFFQVSLSFWFLKIGIDEGASDNMISMTWVLLFYVLRTTGELCISPIAISMVTKLAPARLMSFMMGIFFLAVAFAHISAQLVAKYFTTAASEIKEVAQLHDKAVSFHIFGQIFEFLIYMPLIVGVIMLMISPFFKELFKKHR
jgi:POT family proton-dependent oligopeptide transporter